MMPIDPGVEQRVVDAALRCIARWGVTKTTLDDVAREAGCSRATVYRAFPGGKDALLNAVVATEIARVVEGLHRALEHADGLEDLLVRGVTHAARTLRGHEALRFLLAHEPEVILPRVAFAHMNEVLEVAGRVVGPHLAAYVGEAEAPRAGEWLARIVFSYTLAPSETVDVCDEESVRALVRDFVLPGLVQPATTI